MTLTWTVTTVVNEKVEGSLLEYLKTRVSVARSPGPVDNNGKRLVIDLYQPYRGDVHSRAMTLHIPTRFLSKVDKSDDEVLYKAVVELVRMGRVTENDIELFIS